MANIRSSEEYEEEENELTELTQALKESKIDTPKRTNVEFEDALEETGFGKYNVYVIITSGLLLFAATCETFGIGFVIPAAECELHLDNYKKGILTSVTTVGITASSTFWGFLSDIRGRKKLMTLTLVLSFATSIVSSLMPNFWEFTFLRLINGICVACPSAITFVYLGEFVSTKNRDKSMAFMMIFMALVLTYLPALGWALLKKTFNIQFLGLDVTNWRTYMLINALPSVVATLCLLRLPESPKYLYYNGQPMEALRILRQMYSFNTGLSEDSYPVASLDQKVYQSKSDKKSGLKEISDQIVPLFKPPLLVYTFAACAIQGGLLAISSGLLFWYPDIVNQVAKSGKGSVTICEALSGGFADKRSVSCDVMVEDRVFILNIIIGVYYFVGFTAWGFLVKMLGSRNFFIICMVVSAMSTILLTFISQKILIDVSFISALVVSGIAFPIINARVVEIFPTNVCGMALCTVLTVGRLGSVVASSITGIMIQWNCLVTFALYALNLIVCLGLFFLLPRNS